MHFGKRKRANCSTPTCVQLLVSATEISVKLLPPANFQLFEAHRPDKRATSVGCFAGSRAARPVLSCFESQCCAIANVHWFAHARVELETMYAASGKIAPFVRLGWLAPQWRSQGGGLRGLEPPLCAGRGMP